MSKLSLYIADVDDAFIVNVMNVISHSEHIRVAGYARDGRTALEQINALRPNVLLTDVQLPCIDGIDLMRRAQGVRHPPLCIASTRFYSDTLLEAAQMCGAAYCLYKPIQYSRLPGIIHSCWETRRHSAGPGQRETAAAATRFSVNLLREKLTAWGFPIRMNGSLYIIESLLQLRRDPLLLNNLSKGLYPRLAEQLQSTPAGVERALRGAIAHAYDRGSLSIIFPERPTNRAFLAHVLQELDDVPGASPAESANFHEMLL